MIDALAIWVVALGGAWTAADPEALIKAGLDLRKQGRNAEALERFQDAYAIDQAPRTRAQIGLARQSLGAWLEAERDLAAALAFDDPWIAKNRRTLEDALDIIRSRLGFIDITTNVAGAELFIDGTRTATLPMAAPVRMVIGEVDVEVRHPAHHKKRRTIEVRPYVVAREHIALSPIEPPIVEAPVERPPDRAEPVEPIAVPIQPGGPRPGPWILVASGVILGGAITAHVLAEHEVSIFNGDDCFFGEMTRDQRCGGHKAAARVGRGLAFTGYGLTAIGAALGLYFMLSAPAVTASVSHEGVGIHVAF